MTTFFQVRSLVDQATADSKEPTNGYLYVEINKLTELSDSACTSVLDHLMKRLRNKSVKVKHKALLVMKSCIEKGHPTFRSELQLRAEEIRAELGCSGPPDPHEGDGPYRRVREEADRVLNMMYDEQYASRRAARPQQSMEGGQDSQPPPPPSFLPSPAPSSGGGGGGGGGAPGAGRRYEGMGNWTPPAEEKTWYGSAADKVVGVTTAALEKVGVKSKSEVDWNDKELYTRGAAQGMGSGYGPGGTYVGPATHGGDAGIRGLSAQQAGLFEKKKKKTRRKKGEAGGTWKHEEESESEEEEVPAAAAAGGARRPQFDYAAAQAAAAAEEERRKSSGSSSSPARVVSGTYEGPLYGGPGSADEGDEDAQHHSKISSVSLEGTPEWRLVEAITRPGGVRTHPSDAELRDFCSRSEQLEWRPLARALFARLDENNWVTRLKAMCALHALLERGRPKKLRGYCRKHGDALVGEATSSQKALRQKAEQVCALVWESGEKRAHGRAAGHVDEAAHGGQQQQHAAVASASSGNSNNILSFLDAPQQVPPSAGLAGLSLDSPQPQQQPVLQAPLSQPGLGSLNLAAPTLQAGPTFVAPPPMAAASYPYAQPMYVPGPQGMYVPAGQPMYGQPMYGGQPMYVQPAAVPAAYYGGGVMQQQQQQQQQPMGMGGVGMMSPPPKATTSKETDSFSFVEMAMKSGVK